MKVEQVDPDDGSENIQLRLRVTDPKKRKTPHKDNEAIQFAYNMDKDNPEEVAGEMVRSGFTTEEDTKPICRQIRERVQMVKREREKKEKEALEAAQEAEKSSQGQATVQGQAAAAAATQTSQNAAEVAEATSQPAADSAAVPAKAAESNADQRSGE